MNGQEGGGGKEGHPNSDPPSKSEPAEPNQIGPSSRQSGGSDHKDRGKNQLTETANQLAERIKKSDVWMISLTAVIAVATIVNVYVFYRESEGSARDIREFSTKAGAMVTAINTSLAEDRTAIRETLKDNREAIAATERQINSALSDSTAQGKAVIKSAASQMRLDQRAWVGFIADSVTFVNGNEIDQGIAVQNTGKTPAVNVRMKSQGKLIPHGDEVTQPDYKVRWQFGEDTASASTMPPGNLRQIFVQPVQFTPEGVKQIRSGGVVLYQFGFVTYDDVFGLHHRTDFCVYVLPGLARTADCPKFNDQN
jgi:hypothetical protein